MGQAKRRGTFDERYAAAIARQQADVVTQKEFENKYPKKFRRKLVPAQVAMALSTFIPQSPK